jgi:hypothetical protein
LQEITRNIDHIIVGAMPMVDEGVIEFMSQETALKFIMDARTNDKLKGIARTHKGNVDGLITDAASAGYSFSPSDYTAAAKLFDISGGVTIAGVAHC